MRTPPLIIGAAINMYLNGESYRDMAETLGMLGYSAGHKFLTPFKAQAPHPRLDFARNGSKTCVLDYTRSPTRPS